MPDKRSINGRTHGSSIASPHFAIDARRRLVLHFRLADFAKQTRKARPVPEFNASGVTAQRSVKIAGEWDFGMTRAPCFTDAVLRSLQKRGDRDRTISRDRYEGRIRAVFEEAPHQISEEITMAPDRSVDPNGGGGMISAQELVEDLAHAVQTLEFVSFHASRILDDAGDGECVMRGELRIKLFAQCQELARTHEVTKIGHGLAGEDGIIGQPPLLRALDLGVPIGALDQADGDAATERRPGLGEPIDKRRRTLLIRLHGKPESIPAAQRPVGKNRADHIAGKLEPVRLLRINREVEVARAGRARKLNEPGRELGENALARNRLEPRMQCRELDRDTGPRDQLRYSGRRSDSLDGFAVSCEIAIRIGCGARPLPQHVERVAQLRVATRPLKRFLDGLPKHEMRAKKPHGLARGCPHCGHSKTLEQGIEDVVRGFSRMDDASRDAERPCRGGDQEGVRFDFMRPIATRKLVLDQAVRGGGIRHPQQRLGEHHEGEALLGGQGIRMQKIFDAAQPSSPGADAFDQARCVCIYPALCSSGAGSLIQELGSDHLVRRCIRGSKAPQRARLRDDRIVAA